MKKATQKWSYDPHGSYFIRTPADIYGKNFDRKRHGFRLISSEGFSREDFREYPSSGLLQHFERLSEDYGNLGVYELAVSSGRLYLSHWDNSGLYEEGIECHSPKSGMRLEFETAGDEKHPTKTCVVKFEEDPVFGSIIRIWENCGGVENIITVLEDRRIIAVTNDEATAKIWHREEKFDMERELEYWSDWE
jgi:hypothetical protein